MIRAVLQHHLNRALRGEITNAIRNCHTYGLHSVVLHDEPGNRVRLFYADESHTLWTNDPRYLRSRQTLAIHSHHCELTLIGVFGIVYNHIYSIVECAKAEADSDRFKWAQCRFESAITGAGARLTPTGLRAELKHGPLSALNLAGVAMCAQTLHTISVPKSLRAAWLVVEGAEDPEYSPLCYTNDPEFNPEGLYVRDPSIAQKVLAGTLAELGSRWS